ncbi:potassium channel family protein [Thermoanaerobacterium thermosaccharolyticum]|uniref:Trk system potassium uptake protein TrkA n=1 Tax=Thermoanaerobacterium thermosaccharolyticum TaxID=1517 RepID=A0A231VLM8_THETR|nr:TrkA family potassium uptake protein [Thermoanaerobacterium thermosaccharolyticum]OXT08967.1 potassium transporter TrkA [Thermoanaerobacterium thermosaccharolyticum]
MNIIVAGCGRLGAELAQILDSDGNHVAVIDRDKDAFKRLKSSFKGEFIEGIAFDKATLIKAGIEHADAVASTTNGDNTNIVTALIAKKKFKVPTIVARIYDPIRAEIYRKMGINTVSPTLWGANKIKDLICHPDLFRVSSFGSGEVEIIETEATAFLDGRHVRDIAIPSEINVVSIVRDGIALIPTHSTTFKKGDKIFIALTAFGKTKIKQMLMS